MPRHKKPTQLRIIEGNRGHRKPNQNEPKPRRAVHVPPPPSFLKQTAADEWRRIAPELHSVGLLTDCDLAVLAAYCTAFERWRAAEDALTKMGAAEMLTGALMIRTANGNPIQNPIVGTANRALGDMVRYAAEFGMTPAARSRIQEGAPPAEMDPLTLICGTDD